MPSALDARGHFESATQPGATSRLPRRRSSRSTGRRGAAQLAGSLGALRYNGRSMFFSTDMQSRLDARQQNIGRISAAVSRSPCATARSSRGW